MPTYEYQCKSCGHRFSAFQHMSDAPLEKCPECGGTVERLISGGAGFVFKGSTSYEGGSCSGPSCSCAFGDSE